MITTGQAVELERTPTSAEAQRVEPIGILAERRLWESSHLALRGVSCEYKEGMLILRGRVPTYYLKQLAQTLMKDLNGIELIVNRVEVVQAR